MTATPKILRVKKPDNTVYTPTDRAYFHREAGENIAKILFKAASEAGDETAKALAKRINDCSSKLNYYVAEDLVNSSTGECFEGFGHLCACGSKLCHGCQAKAGSRNRKTAREALENTPLRVKQHYCYELGKNIYEREKVRFFTFTLPKTNLSCLASLRLLAAVWEKFRKDPFVLNYFQGYVKSAEFSTRKDNTFHSHFHILVIGFFTPQRLLKDVWYRCVETAFEEAGLEFEADDVVVNLQLVSSIEAALQEVCKYMTKSDSWSKIPTSHLLEIANVKRFPRMFELCGTLKKTAQRLKKEKERAKQEAALAETEARELGEDYVHTKSLTDEKLELVDSRFEDPVGFVEKESPEIRENWRELVKRIGYERYLIIWQRQVEAQQRTRKLMLISKYPLATFRDLTGFVWYSPEYEFREELTADRVEVWEKEQVL